MQRMEADGGSDARREGGCGLGCVLLGVTVRSW
jgi:hypothetical protein